MPPSKLLLERCARIEEAVGALYRRFAEATPCTDAAKALWRRLARDEDDHAAQLRLAQRLARERGFEAGPVRAGELDRVEARLQALVRAAQERPMTHQEAVLKARELERDFQKLHADHALSIADEGVASLFRHLARHDEEHQETLGDLGRLP